VQQLEQRLQTQRLQLDRAEGRCGEALAEMRAMKQDMLTLVSQLSDSEARYLHLSRLAQESQPPPAPIAPPAVPTAVPQQQHSGRLLDLERANRSKADKIRGYREVIVRLKDEFLRAEADRAARDAEDRTRSSVPPGVLEGVEELKELRRKASELQEGLRLAREDLDKARQARERLSRERQRLEGLLEEEQGARGRAEGLAKTAQEAFQRVRRELEEARRREVRLKERLKAFEAEGQPTARGLGAQELLR